MLLHKANKTEEHSDFRTEHLDAVTGKYFSR